VALLEEQVIEHHKDRVGLPDLVEDDAPQAGDGG
jgi:hypothetical protein